MESRIVRWWRGLGAANGDVDDATSDAAAGRNAPKMHSLRKLDTTPLRNTGFEHQVELSNLYEFQSHSPFYSFAQMECDQRNETETSTELELLWCHAGHDGIFQALQVWLVLAHVFVRAYNYSVWDLLKIYVPLCSDSLNVRA